MRKLRARCLQIFRLIRPLSRIALPAIAWILIGYAPGPAQEPVRQDTTGTIVDSSTARDSARSGGSRLIPYPVLFYSPETGVGFGAGAIWFFQPSGSRLSSISPVLFYTSKKQFSISAQLDSWFNRNRWRILADVGFSRFPAKYWGGRQRDSGRGGGGLYTAFGLGQGAPGTPDNRRVVRGSADVLSHPHAGGNG